ncbi:hypothetical protein Prudu_005916, partial [Prunus dulcis]
YKGFKREDERVLGFARESRRGEEAISGDKFVVVLVAEVISGDPSVVLRTSRGILAGYRLIAERRRRGAILLDTSPQRKSPGGTGGAWLMGTGRVLQGKALSSTFLPTSSSVKWGPISKEQEDEVECGWHHKGEHESGQALRESRAKKAKKSAEKRPRDDDEGRVADVLGKRKALEEAHQHAPPKLPFGMEDVFAEGVEKVDFGRLRQQKKEVNLAMHLAGGAFVNVFLEGVKSDSEALARTPASSFIDRAQKTILTSACAFGEMYVSMAKADKEIQRLKRRDKLAKSKIAEAQEAIERRTPCWCKRRPWPRRWRS